MKKILIVEDVEFNRDLMVQLLEEDYETVVAEDGVEGIALAASERPDLILMDMSLPLIGGWKATRRIKAKPELKHILVIALTAHAKSGDEEKARAAGCDDYLTKPLDESLLFSRIEHYLGKDSG